MQLFFKVVFFTVWYSLGFIFIFLSLLYSDGFLLAAFAVWFAITAIALLVKWIKYRKENPPLTKEQKQRLKQWEKERKYRNSEEFKKKYISEVEIENSYFGNGVFVKDSSGENIFYTDIKSGFEVILPLPLNDYFISVLSEQQLLCRHIGRSAGKHYEGVSIRRNSGILDMKPLLRHHANDAYRDEI